MRFKKSQILAVLIGLLLMACKKDRFRPNWDTDISTPLFRTEMGLDNFIPDSLLETNDDGTQFILLENFEYKVDLDGLGDIFDTSLVKSFPDVPFSTRVPPGYRYINSFESKIGAKTFQLSRVLISSGKIKFTAKSTIEEKTVMSYEILNSSEINTKEPAILENFEIPKGSKSSPSEKIEFFDISNYEFDLRGKDFLDFNTLISEIDVRINPKGDSAVVGGNSKIELTINFVDIILKLGRGYLGQEKLEIENKEEELGIFKNVTDGKIDLDGIELDLMVRNYLGADVNGKFEELFVVSNNGSEEALEHEELGKSLNLSRAREVNNEVTPSLYNLNFNSDNSNIEELFEILPTSFGFSGSFELNPLGNVSNGNDFIYFDNTIGVEVDFMVPLKIGIDGLELTDTLEFDFQEKEILHKVNYGTLTILAKNTFPIEATIQMLFLDRKDRLIESVKSSDKIKAGILSSNGKVDEFKESKVSFELNPEEYNNFRKTKKIVLKSRFNSLGKKRINLYKEYKLELTLVGDFNYKVETNNK